MAFAAEKSSSPSQHPTTDGHATSVRKSKRSSVNVQDLLTMYNNPSLKMDQIAKHFNIAVPEIYFLLETSGLPFQHRKKPTKKLSERTHSMIMAMHASGIPASQIAERFGISKATVYKRIERAKNKTRKPVVQEPKYVAPIPQPKPLGFWARLIRRLFG